MAEGTVVSTPLLSGVVSDNVCQHEIDEKSLPEWDKRVGKVYKCVKCGAKVFKEVRHVPKPGERIHLSKKERRRRKREWQSTSSTSKTTE